MAFVTLLLLGALIPQQGVFAADGKAVPEEKVIALIQELQASDDLVVAWETLSVEEQDAVTAYVTPTTIRSNVYTEDAPSLNGVNPCTTRRADVAAYNGVGSYRTWSYYNEITWCHDGTSVIASSTRVWGDVGNLSVGWSYDGEQSSSTTPLPGVPRAEHFSQGKFSLCLPLCVTGDYPWLKSYLWADGRFEFERGF